MKLSSDIKFDPKAKHIWNLYARLWIKSHLYLCLQFIWLTFPQIRKSP